MFFKLYRAFQGLTAVWHQGVHLTRPFREVIEGDTCRLKNTTTIETAYRQAHAGDEVKKYKEQKDCTFHSQKYDLNYVFVSDYLFIA